MLDPEYCDQILILFVTEIEYAEQQAKLFGSDSSNF